MKERPILFSTPMVQAERMGNKTQTRRTYGLDIINQDPNSFDFLHCYMLKNGDYFASFNSPKGTIDVKCPFGNIGDVLWVREAYYPIEINFNIDRYIYKADADKATIDGEPLKWKPSLFMPKSAARIFLEITNVRVERLGDISESDAIAEGIDVDNVFPLYKDYNKKTPEFSLTPTESYRTLWQSINGKGSWNANPYVWVIEFKRLGGLK